MLLHPEQSREGNKLRTKKGEDCSMFSARIFRVWRRRIFFIGYLNKKKIFTNF